MKNCSNTEIINIFNKIIFKKLFQTVYIKSFFNNNKSYIYHNNYNSLYINCIILIRIYKL